MRLAFAAIAAVLLAACGPSEPAPDAASTAPAPDSAAPAAPSAPAASAPAIEVPVEGPAAGKWRMTVTAMGQAMPPTEQCLEKQVSLEEAERMRQQAGITCTEQSYRKDGDAWIGHSVCSMDIGGQKIATTTDTRVTGDLSSRYTVELTSKMDPPPMPSMAEQKMTMTAERMGDC